MGTFLSSFGQTTHTKRTKEAILERQARDREEERRNRLEVLHARTPQSIGIQERLITVLRWCAEWLREVGLPVELAERMERLTKQVDQPCVVAVVGQLNVGKSTFVNALLGEDFARVGTTETTATINYFTYGNPADPRRPIRCHWRDGGYTDEDRAFLDGLHCNDPETLRRAAGIGYLEYFVPSPYLKQVTLVDTPGTGAVPDEHQNATAEFLQLQGQLRERHADETNRIEGSADAVIYLVGQIARATDQGLLDEFKDTTGGRSTPLNAIGVMSKIELQPEIMARRHELSEKISSQLKEGVNIVIPVGSGVQRCLQNLLIDNRVGLRRLLDALRCIPSEMLESLLRTDRRFLNEDYDDCPISVAERRALFDALPEDARRWPIFATVVRTAAELEFDVDKVETALKEISNFDVLEDILNKRFIERGRILRCHRIVYDAKEVLNEILYTHLPQHRRGRYPDIDELEKLHQYLGSELDTVFQQLWEYNKDFETLQQLEENAEEFIPEQLEELRALLGRYGGDIEQRLQLPPGTRADVEHLSSCMWRWIGATGQAPGTVRYDVIDRALTRYGLILDELITASEGRDQR